MEVRRLDLELISVRNGGPAAGVRKMRGEISGLAAGFFGGSTPTHLCAAMAAAWFVVRVCPTMVAAAELTMHPPMAVVELSRA
jgi:hypothetical protein